MSEFPLSPTDVLRPMADISSLRRGFINCKLATLQRQLRNFNHPSVVRFVRLNDYIVYLFIYVFQTLFMIGSEYHLIDFAKTNLQRRAKSEYKDARVKGGACGRMF